MITNGKQKTSPRISVITPSYNQGRFLEACILSVVEQQYPDVEHIIIDGGSTDESLRVIDKHRAHLAYLVSEPDNGQSDAINKGFRTATGDLVTWLNADDFYLPGAFHAAAAAHDRNLRASFYFGDGWRVDEAGKLLSRFFPDGMVLFNRNALILGLNYILQPATFINRAYLEQTGLLNPSLKYGMDTDLWIRLANLAPPHPITACLAASREYASTKTSTGSFPRAEELRQIAEKHSGLALTPGALCYYLDTLHRLAEERSDVYPAAFLADLRAFWQSTSRLFSALGARADGFPMEVSP